MSFMFSLNGITYEYTPFHRQYEVEPSVTAMFYGISLHRYDPDRRITLERIPGITTNREVIIKLAELLSNAKVSRYHFRDVIEDYFS